MARDDPMMRFRAPQELKSKIEASATENGRSLNAEIVHRLELSFESATPRELFSGAKRSNFSLEFAELELEECRHAVELSKEILADTELDTQSTEMDRSMAKFEVRRAERAVVAAERTVESLRKKRDSKPSR